MVDTGEYMRIGKITENALKRSVLKQLRTEYKGIKSAVVGSDCAFSDEEKVFSAVSPMGLCIEDLGYYCVMKAANSLIAQGITPDHVTLCILLPEEAEEKSIKIIVNDAICAARELGIMYAGGHTETTQAVNRPVVVATASGYNSSISSVYENKPVAGQDIVVSKHIALEGTAMLASTRKAELSQRYPMPFIDNAAGFKKYMNIRKEAEIAISAGVSAIHDISNGGIFAALWEMSEKGGCGLYVDLKKIPVRQETIEICEFFEANPYQMLSGGALLMASDNGKELAEKLMEADIPAVVIGSFKEGNDRMIINDDEERFLELPQSDEINRILG